MKKQTGIKYTWQFWLIVVAEISLIVIILVWFCLSVKAIVQDIQMMCYQNKVEGTVTTAEFEGGKTVTNGNGSGSSIQYEHVRYVITFDRETAGHNQYEYHADNIITVRKQEGSRYIVLFNELSNPALIQKEDIAADNVILISFLVFAAAAVFFRRKIWRWIVKISQEADKYIFL